MTRSLGASNGKNRNAARGARADNGSTVTRSGVHLMTTVIKHAGDVTTLRYAVGECSLGLVLVARSDKGICAILLGDAARELVRELQQRFPHSTLVDGGADF